MLISMRGTEHGMEDLKNKEKTQKSASVAPQIGLRCGANFGKNTSKETVPQTNPKNVNKKSAVPMVSKPKEDTSKYWKVVADFVPVGPPAPILKFFSQWGKSSKVYDCIYSCYFKFIFLF